MAKTLGQAGREEKRAKEKELEDIVALARRKSIDAFMRIVSLAEDKKPEDWNETDWGKWVPLRVRSVKDYMLAQNTIVERAHGKAPQAVNIGDNEGGPLQIQVIIRQKEEEPE